MTESVWHNRGRIFVREGGDFFKSHATRPIPYELPNGQLRLFFSSRCGDDMPLPTFIDVDAQDPSRISYVNEEPLLPLGRTGTFDDSGVTPVCILRTPEFEWMYYVGWKRRRYGVTIETSIGVAVLEEGGRKLRRLFEGPILGQDRDHPLMVAAPFVRKEGALYRMWYCSGTEWRQFEHGSEPVYTVFYAESSDGLTWRPLGRPVIPYAFDGEVVSAPWVVRRDGDYSMWYSTRGSNDRIAKQYKIGRAVSADGMQWIRQDADVSFPRSTESWDSEMACYPALIERDGRTFLFYCGNAVGRGGIGYAVADAPLAKAA